MLKTVLIDHYDSFTYLLAQVFGELGGHPVVVQHDLTSLAAIRHLKPTHIVLSPGPGNVDTPRDFGIGFDVIRAFYKTVPLLGVCLGHQGIWRFFGGSIVRAPRVMHGKRSLIYHQRQGILRGLPNPFEAMRYHSLVAKESAIGDLSVTARSDRNEVMAIQHQRYPIFGVQFHPESLGTRYGRKIVKNFLHF